MKGIFWVYYQVLKGTTFVEFAGKCFQSMRCINVWVFELVSLQSSPLSGQKTPKLFGICVLFMDRFGNEKNVLFDGGVFPQRGNKNHSETVALGSSRHLTTPLKTTFFWLFLPQRKRNESKSWHFRWTNSVEKSPCFKQSWLYIQEDTKLY